MNYLGALSAGFTVEQVLNYLSKNFPDLGPRIKQAFNSGKSPEDIIKYISKFDGKQLSSLKSNRKPFEPFPESGTSNRYIQGQNAQKELNPIPQSVKTGMLGAAGLMAAPMAASALSSALPAARTALSRAAPQLLGQGSIPGAPPPNIPSIPILNAPNSVNQQPTPQNTSVSQTKAINVIDLLNKHKFSEKIESILKSGNDPEQAAAFYRELNPTTVTQIEKEAGRPFEEVIREYAQLKTPKEEVQVETALENPLEEPSEEDKLGFKTAFATLKGGAISNNLYEGIFKSLQEGKDTFAGLKDSLLQAAKPAFDAGQINSVEDLKRFADFWNKSKQNPPEEMPPESTGGKPRKPKYPPPPNRPSGTSNLSRRAIEESFKQTPVPAKSVEKAAKGQIVDTPEGIGEVREIRNGKALVEVDGKMRQMLEDELMSPGLPQKDLADLHEELIEGIKTHTGKEVSRHVEWAGYDPEHKELIYKPWSGEQYTYDGIDQEDADMLTSLLTQRKTSGENYIGAWQEGSDSPIGAAMHKLLTKLREKSKEAGKEKAHIRKYETIYSAYEPAQKASKKKKDEERKRIRAEEKRRKEAEKQALKHSRSLSRVS